MLWWGASLHLLFLFYPVFLFCQKGVGHLFFHWDSNVTRDIHAEAGIARKHNDSGRIGMMRAIVKLRWVFLYAITVLTIIWWYEFRPAQLASWKLQGDWQSVEGVIPNEQLGESYLHIDDNETWFVYPASDKWNVQRSRITLKQADNFFVVRRSFGFDYGNTRETEYIVCFKNDEVYMLRGLARLDSVKERSVEKLRRVDSLPDKAMECIREYLLDRVP